MQKYLVLKYLRPLLHYLYAKDLHCPIRIIDMIVKLMDLLYPVYRSTSLILYYFAVL